MKIGILTVPFNNNYGGYLQAYALKTVLKEMGHEVVFINRQRNINKSLKLKIYRFLVNNHLIKDFIAEKNQTISVNTQLFVQQYLSPISPAYYSSDQMKESLKMGIDLFIVGSDQVWRYKYAEDSIDDFFFGFIEKSNNIPRISYAASFGTDSLDYPADKIDIIRELLSRFKAISVREKSGEHLLSKYFDVPSLNTHTVLDPTLLLDADSYKSLFKNIRPEVDKYLLTYILDKDEVFFANINRFCMECDLEITDIKAQTGHYRSLDVIEPVEKWLSLFYYAEYIVTDSFHGTVFSILFHKPFVVFANPIRGVARLHSLLSIFGLEERLVTDSRASIDNVLRKPIVWDLVDDILDNNKANSLDFLKDSINKDNCFEGS